MNSHDRQFWANNIVIFVYDYNNCKNIFLCTKNRSESAMAYPDELTGELPQEKRDGDIKMFQNENK